MKDGIKWIVIGLLLSAIFVLSMMKPPEAITTMLANVSAEVKLYSAIIHIVFLVVIVAGVLYKSIRTPLFSTFIAFLSLCATVIAFKYRILPSVLLFGTYLILCIRGYLTQKLDFDLEHISSSSLLFGILGLLFGFWYLHWTEGPVWLNAVLYSPLGAVNCPTMAVICGFLCLTKKPRSVTLETTVALTTLYFGFFGLFRLGAYVDIVLILCALFLMVRLGSYLVYDGNFEKRSVQSDLSLSPKIR